MDLAAAGMDRLLAEAIAGRRGLSADIGPAMPDVGLAIAIAPIRDGNGHVTGASLVARDISDRLRDQQHQALVVNELHHRVKNTLAVVQAIARQTFKDVKDPASAGAQFLARLGSLSRTQSLLDQNCWRGLTLRDVAAEQVAPYTSGNEARCTLDGPGIILRASAAVALGMTFHELATNSAKYGAFSVPGGRVTLHWMIESAEEGQRLRLCWREFGGPLVNAPSTRGLGSRMVEHGLARELGARAELQFRRSGVWYNLAAPLSSLELS